MENLLMEYCMKRISHRKYFHENTYKKETIQQCVDFLRKLNVIKGHIVNKNF
jgi:hypothetical protein